jgi:Transposase DDE domain group 1
MGQVTFTLVAWFKRLVLPPASQRTTIKTIRHHLLNLVGKLVRTARRCFLVLSQGYRYQAVWQFTINRLGALQFT